MNNSANKLFENLIIFMFGSFGSKALAFLMIPLYTSILSTMEYGEIDIITTSTNLLIPIVTLGLTDAIFRFTMSRDYKNNCVLSIGFYFSLIFFSILFCILQIINQFLEWKYMSIMLVLLFSDIIYEIFINYIKAIGKSKEYVALGMLQTFIALLSNVIFLIPLALGIRGYVYAYIISYLVPALFIVFKEQLYNEIKIKRFDLKLAKKMIVYSFPLIFSTLSWWIITSSDRYMIRYYLDSSSVGIYSIACKIPTILQTFVTILQTVWQISINEIFEENMDELKAFFEKFTILFRSIGYISGSFMILICQLLMKIIAKNDFYQGWVYVPYLILSVTFSMAPGMVSALYGAFKKNGGVFWSVLLGAFINIGLNIVLIPYMGILGATISTAISRLIISIYRMVDTQKLLEFDRGYHSIAVNSILIVLQATCCIFVSEYRYLIQMILTIIICLYNRDTIIMMRKFLFKRCISK